MTSLRALLAPGLSWRSTKKENARLDSVAAEIAELARSRGLVAELRPQIGDYRPALLLEYEEEGRQAGCVLSLRWDYEAKRGRRGSVHLADLAWIVQVARQASELRGRDYTPVLVTGQRLYGTAARFAYEEGVFVVDADPASERAALDVGWALGFVI